MAVTYVGGLTLAAALPGVGAGLTTALGDIQAKAEALASFQPTVALGGEAQIALAASILASVTAALSAGISPPSMSVQLELVAALLVEVRAELAILLNLFGLLAASAHVYSYSGRADDLGGEFATELAAGFPGGAAADASNALLLATTDPTAWAAMSQVFKVTP